MVFDGVDTAWGRSVGWPRGVALSNGKMELPPVESRKAVGGVAGLG